MSTGAVAALIVASFGGGVLLGRYVFPSQQTRPAGRLLRPSGQSTGTVNVVKLPPPEPEPTKTFYDINPKQFAQVFGILGFDCAAWLSLDLPGKLEQLRRYPIILPTLGIVPPTPMPTTTTTPTTTTDPYAMVSPFVPNKRDMYQGGLDSAPSYPTYESVPYEYDPNFKFGWASTLPAPAPLLTPDEQLAIDLLDAYCTRATS